MSDESTEKQTKLALAADVHSVGELSALCRATREFVSVVKLGMTTLLPDQLMRGVSTVKYHGLECFVDLKLHDIPSVVSEATDTIRRTGADYFTVDGLAGVDSLQAALKASEEMLTIGVTPLSSMRDQVTVEELTGSTLHGMTVSGVSLATAHAGNLHMFDEEYWSDVEESWTIDQAVVTGVRLDDEANDHRDVIAAEDLQGRDPEMVVVGRPIVGADSPRNAARRFAEALDPDD